MTNKDNLNNKKEENNILSGSIFEDFENNNLLNEEIENDEKEIKKDFFHYVLLGSNFLKIINFILIIFILIIASYIKIQDFNKPIGLLNPICSLFLGKDISYNTIIDIGDGVQFNSCMGISLAIKTINKTINNEIESIYERLSKIAVDLYIMEDFMTSKEVIFLLNSSENKKNPLDLLVKFDKVKNKFLVSDKLRIQCNKIIVTSNELEANCNAYSSLWDTSIPGYNGGKNQNDLRGGTSISIASSFLNFLEKQGDFILINKQKKFKIQDTLGEGGYSFKTPFKIHLSKRNLKLK